MRVSGTLGDGHLYMGMQNGSKVDTDSGDC